MKHSQKSTEETNHLPGSTFEDLQPRGQLKKPVGISCSGNKYTKDLPGATENGMLSEKRDGLTVPARDVVRYTVPNKAQPTRRTAAVKSEESISGNSFAVDVCYRFVGSQSPENGGPTLATTVSGAHLLRTYTLKLPALRGWMVDV